MVRVEPVETDALVAERRGEQQLLRGGARGGPLARPA